MSFWWSWLWLDGLALLAVAVLTAGVYLYSTGPDD
jgi:hypothetical protein